LHVCLLWRMSLQILCPFLVELLIFFSLSYKCSLHILDTRPLSDMTGKYFLLCYGLSFHVSIFLT
jgi:hypothetical protein